MLKDKSHILKAKNLLAAGDNDSLRYCALELRTCIELMCYDRLSMYIDEIPKEFLKKWRPQDVVNILLECDPYSDKDCTVSFAKELSGGATGPRQMFGSSKGISKKFIQSHYHKLAHYLHAPTLADIKAGEIRPLADVKIDLQATLNEIEILAQGTMLANFGEFVTFTCQICQLPNKRNKAGLSEGKKVKCINPNCPAEFTIHDLEEKISQIKPVRAGWSCLKCQTNHFILPKEVIVGKRLCCSKCKVEWKIGYSLKSVEGIENNEAKK
ncbi:MAG: hypothetical protein Q7R35_18595 [Elusimicrobiota bacterium]|nr:hypothetical protein [Elusimicrobiota bacterium]